MLLLMGTFTASSIYLCYTAAATARILCEGHKDEKWDKVRKYLLSREVTLLCSSLVFGFTILYLSINIILPRYIIWALPVCLVLVAIYFSKKLCIKHQILIIIPLIAANLLNHEGALYPKISRPEFEGSGAHLERSMEYRADLIVNQRMATFAENELNEYYLVTGWPFTHILSSPEFGYIKHPLKVLDFNGMGLPALNIPSISRSSLPKFLRKKPYVLISTKNIWFSDLQFNPKRDHLLKEVNYENRSIHFFNLR
jgi:hypothetical protein